MSCWEGYFAHRVTIAETEDSFDLIISDTLLDTDHVLIKGRALSAS